MLQIRLFIAGDWQAPHTARYRDVINPANEEVLAQVAVAGPLDAQSAISAARQAFDQGPWPTMPVTERARLLQRIAGLIEQDAEHLARLAELPERSLPPGMVAQIEMARVTMASARTA